jgi:ubiquinone biosynthesis protein UbiJ
MSSGVISNTAIAVLNHLLEPASWARGRLAGYADSVVSLCAGRFALLFRISNTGHLASCSEDAVPAVTITVPTQALPGLLSAREKSLPADIRIEGSAELADALGFVLRNLRWDAEEDLSRMIGDIAARRAAMAAQSLGQTGARALDSLAGNLSERIDEGDAPVVGRVLHDGFAADVSTLRDAVARLDKRLKRLRDKHRS